MSSRVIIVAICLGALALCAVGRAKDEVIVVVMPDDAKAKFAKLDLDGDRSLTWEEFRASASKDKEPVAKRDFHLFDLDHNGKLTPDEFWTIPSSVTKASTRGPLDDPLLVLLKAFIAALDQHFDNWDKNPKQLVDLDTFLAEIRATLKLEIDDFSDEDVDFDENGVSRAEARRFLEVLIGARRRDGRLLREPNGRVRQHQKFQTADFDQDGRLNRREFVERTFIPGDLATLFERADADRDGFVSWDEWCEKALRVTDPVVDFQKLDTNLDGKVDADELRDGAPKHMQDLARFVFPGFDFDKDGKLSLDEYRLTMLANPVAKWHDDFRDDDGDGRLSWREFQRDGDVPLLRFIDFKRLDQNGDGSLDPSEFAFKHRVPRAVYLLTIADGSWRRLFEMQDFPSITSLEVSPDGQRIVCDAHREGESFTDDVVLTCKLDGTELRNFGKGMVPCWSPDGKQIALTRSSDRQENVVLMSVNGAGERRLHGGRGPVFSRDGKRLAFTDRQSLLVCDLATETTKRVFDVASRGYDRFYRKLAWSPDGKRIGCVGHKPDGTEELLVLTIDDKPPVVKLLHTDRTIEGSVSWHPNGERLVFPMRNRSQERLQLFEINTAGNAGETAPRVVKGQDPAIEVRAACWTPDGKQLIVITGNY